MGVKKSTALRLKRHLPILRKLKGTKSKKERAELLTRDILRTVCECAKNELHFGIPLKEAEKKRLKRYKKQTLYLVDPKKSLQSKKKKLVQSGGFLGALLGPALMVIPELISKILGK